MQNLRLLQLGLWRVLSCGIQRALLAICFMLVSCLAHSSTLKTEVTCSSETIVDFRRTTCRCIPEARTLRQLSYCN
jgi:hypothetical protein